MIDTVVEERPFQLREHSIKAKDLIEHMDGRGAILTDDNLLDEALAEHGLRPDTWLMVVPEQMFALVIIKGRTLQSVEVYDSEAKAQAEIVRFMTDKLDCLADRLNGNPDHDYRETQYSVDSHDWWSFEIEPIHGIE